VQRRPDHLPEKMRTPVQRRMREAYHADSALQAEAMLTAMAKEPDKTHPGAAASLREGMAQTLTVLRLGLTPTPSRTLRSTNAIESMISISREHSRNTGVIVAQVAVPVEHDDTVESLTERIKAVERAQLVDYVGRLAREGFRVDGRRILIGT